MTGESDATSQLSREHAVVTPVAGAHDDRGGGKYTTYRVMAKDAVDAATEHSRASRAGLRHRQVPLIGAEGFPALWNGRERLAETPDCTSPASSTSCAATEP